MAVSVFGGGGAAIAAVLVGLLRIGIGVGTATSVVLGVSTSLFLSGLAVGLHLALGVTPVAAFVAVAGAAFAATLLHEALP